MPYFPQLNTGAAAQFPLRWTDSFRAVANEMPCGKTMSAPDSGATGVSWELSLAGLSESERASLQAFFEQMRGSLNSFTVVDPADNLLAFSEDLTQPCWAPGPLLTVAGGVADPLRGSAAQQVTNTAQTTQGFVQQTNAPGGCYYSFSVYVRSETPQVIVLSQSCNGSVLQKTFTSGQKWERIALSGLPASGSGVSFGIQLTSGATVQLFGAQAEGQCAAGVYKRTGPTGAVYEDCRFAQDDLQMVATGPGAYRCSFRITSAGAVTWKA